MFIYLNKLYFYNIKFYKLLKLQFLLFLNINRVEQLKILFNKPIKGQLDVLFKKSMNL